MKRAFVFLTAAAVATNGIISAGAAVRKVPPRNNKVKASPTPRPAPGDEYFGRMQISVLGVNNSFRDGRIRAGSGTTNEGIINTLRFAQEALDAWARKYPADTWLPRSTFLAERAWEMVYTAEGQQNAQDLLHRLTSRYGKSYFGKMAARQLAHGFVAHIIPTPSPVPCPTATVAPLPSPSAIISASPVPTLPAGVTPSPVPSFSPTPTPTPVPCFTPLYKPASPSPIPSGTLPIFNPLPVPAPTPSPPPSPPPAARGRPAPTPAATATEPRF